MQVGEVFYGFREMMPRFPPTYKRKLNEAGECGDYTRYDDLVRGYSHTGEDKEVGGRHWNGVLVCQISCVSCCCLFFVAVQICIVYSILVSICKNVS